MSQFTIVRDEKQPLGVLIKPAYREDVSSAFFGKKIDDRLHPLIFCSGYYSGRFIQHVIDICLILDFSAAVTHGIRQRLHIPAGVFYDRAANRHQSFSYISFQFASCPCIHVSQIFIESHGTSPSI